MSEIEKQFFETFEIEPKYKFKGCENGITFYTYGCDIPSCKGCPKEIREKEYPQITDRILLELIVILGSIFICVEDVETLKDHIINQCIMNRENIKHQVQSLFKEYK